MLYYSTYILHIVSKKKNIILRLQIHNPENQCFINQYLHNILKIPEIVETYLSLHYTYIKYYIL